MTRERAGRVLLWDFDGTLGYREGGVWSASLLQALREADPTRALTLEEIRPLTQAGFPWHRPEVPHPHLSQPEAWWAALDPVLEAALTALGYAPEELPRLRLGERLRSAYLAGPFRLFDDVLPTLGALAERGWTHAILSNHVPELGMIVQRVGLAEYVRAVCNSAEIGYEKPHPQAFRIALQRLGHPEVAWMIGDNPVADVAGAEAVGIPAILVRSEAAGVRRRAATLADVTHWLE